MHQREFRDGFVDLRDFESVRLSSVGDVADLKPNKSYLLTFRSNLPDMHAAILAEVRKRFGDDVHVLVDEDRGDIRARQGIFVDISTGVSDLLFKDIEISAMDRYIHHFAELPMDIRLKIAKLILTERNDIPNK